MSRYTGPRLRRVRQLGVPLAGLTRKSAQRHPYPPGQGARTRRFRISEYKKRLTEKQRVRYNYGVHERQLRVLMAQAKNSREPTGLVLLRLLEQRLDNIVFRLGFAPTIPAARQLVSHGHVLVDQKYVDIASYRVHPGQNISIRDKSKQLDCIQASLEQPSLRMPPFLSLDTTSLEGCMEFLPTRDDIPIQVDEQLIVEYYAQRL